MHQIIFIDGLSGVGKSTLARRLFAHYRGTYIEQHMIPEFISKTGGEAVVGRDEDEILYACMVALIKTFCAHGYYNVLALDFNGVRMRDIPEDFKGYDYVILRLTCEKEQNIRQMQNREEGLKDVAMLERAYAQAEAFPRPKLPNEWTIDVTGQTQEAVFEQAVRILDAAQPAREYAYEKPDRRCFTTWVQADQAYMDAPGENKE